jgi:hypothetical protein
MTKYAALYLTTFEKQGGFGDVLSGVGNFAKGIVVDPLVGMYNNGTGAIGAAMRGDWSDAGGKGLSFLGDTAATALNASWLIPGVGPAVGLGGRALLAGGKAAYMGSNAIRAAHLAKSVQAANTASKGLKALDATAKGLTSIGTRLGTAGGKGIAASGKFNKAIGGIKSKVETIPGAAWAGLGKPSIKNTAKSIAAFTGLGLGGEFLQNRGLRGQYEQLAVDPNFREWIGPDRQDLMIERVRNNDDKVTAMRSLKDKGYMDTFHKHQRDQAEKRRMFAEDQDRIQQYQQQREFNAA